jgi:DNA-binding transcriptional regulator YhcF (GntR family)
MYLFSSSYICIVKLHYSTFATSVVWCSTKVKKYFLFAIFVTKFLLNLIFLNISNPMQNNLKFKIDIGSQIPVYKQIIQNVNNLLSIGELNKGEFLPSMNELADYLEISKETVKKAYSFLRKDGIIESAHGKGFYVTLKNDKTKILLLFDKLSTYKQVLYNSFSANMPDNTEITIRLHNQDLVLFENFIDENLDKFDFYIVTPHFSLNEDVQKRVIKALKKLPNRKLIVLDRNMERLPGNFGAVYQDFENDVYEGLMQGLEDIKRFRKFNIVSMPGSLYAPLIESGVKRFCEENSVEYEFHYNISADKIQKSELFLILNSQLDSELIQLIKFAKDKGCKIGKDVGIISYNESPINEIILDGLTVLSTDFMQMGSLAADMVKSKTFRKLKCDFKLIRRDTF